MEMEEDRNERMCPGYNLVGLKVEGDKQVAVLKQEGRKIFAEATVFNQKGEIVATLEGIFIVLKE